MSYSLAGPHRLSSSSLRASTDTALPGCVGGTHCAVRKGEEKKGGEEGRDRGREGQRKGGRRGGEGGRGRIRRKKKEEATAMGFTFSWHY